MAPKKAQKMSLGSFLENTDFGTTGSWADDMPELPTAPAPKDDDSMMMRGGDFLSSRPDRGPAPPRDDVPLPTRPPFTAFVGNLSFDARESDIKQLFASDGNEITQVKIISDREGKPKGFGYVEFATVEGLKLGLAKHGMSFSNRQIRVNVAEPQKEREGGFRGGDDEKFDRAWRRDGPLPARDDFASGGPRRRFDNTGGGPGAEPREPSASEGVSDWRSSRPPPRFPSDMDGPPRRKGSNFSSHEGQSAADTEDKWTMGSRFKPNQSTDNQPGSRFGSVRGRPEGSAVSPTSAAADEGPWRRARPAGSTSPTGSVPPTPNMGRRKLDLLPRSTNASTQPSPLSSPKEKSVKPNPFGNAVPVDVRAKEEAAAAKIEESKERLQQHQPMSRTNSRQPQKRPGHPTRADSGHDAVEREGTDSAPRSPASGAASPVPSHASTTPNVRPNISFASAAAKKQADISAEPQSADAETEAVTQSMAEVEV